MSTKISTTAAAIASIEAGLAFLKTSNEDEGATQDTSKKVPTAAELKKLDKAGIKAAAEGVGIDIEGVKLADLKSLLTTFAAIMADEDVTPEAANALAAALGVTPEKKAAKTVAALKAFGESLGETEEEESSEDAEDTEDSEDEDSEDAEDEDSEDSEEEDSEESEDDEDSEDEDSEDDESEDEDEDDESEDEEESEEEDADESEDEDEEEVSPKEQKSRLAAYNAVAKKKAKDYAALVKLLGDNKWGVPYVDGEEGKCCGIPLAETSDESVGKCTVTGKFFSFDGEDFEECDEPAAKKVAKKVKK